MFKTPLAILLATVLGVGCVSQGKYDEAVSKTKLTQAQLERSNQSLAESAARADQQRAEIARLEALIGSLSRSSSSDRASSDAAIADLRKRLDELKSAHAAADARAAIFRDVALRLKKQVDAGDLTIVVRDGRMVLQLPNDVLFDTGRTEIKPAGKSALEAIAGVLASMPARHFQVAGHTDNVPIHTGRFPSNWELSSARALGVVHFLIEKGVSPDALSAAGYGEMDPVAANGDAGGRRQNRRTEIVLQPNIDEMVRVP